MVTTKEVKPKVEVVEEPVFTPFDPWTPILKNSPSLHTTPEQELYIREILEICCSDSAFAKKAYAALQYILTGAEPVPAVISSLNPSTAVISTPVSLVVTGTGFTATSVISFGGPVATTFVSDTELSASVTTPSAEGTIPVTVVTDGMISNSVDFTVTAVTLLAAVESKKFEESKKDEKK